MKSADLHLFEAEIEIGPGKKLRTRTYEKVYATDASKARFLLIAKYSGHKVTFTKGPTKVKDG